MSQIDDLVEVLFTPRYPVDEARQRDWQDFASLMWQTVCEVLGERPHGSPDLRIVHGTAARPQIISTEATECLVYDESLDPWLLRLTELATGKVPLAEAESSFLHLMSQRQYLSGNFAQAARDALVVPAATAAGLLRRFVDTHRNTDTGLDTPPGSAPDWVFPFQADDLVHVEREFIIAHELVHIFLTRFPDRRADLADDYRHMVIAENRRTPIDEELAQQIASFSNADVRWATERQIGRRVPADLAAELLSVFDAATTKERIDAMDRLVAQVPDNPDLMEECICDLLASICMVMMRRNTGRLRLCQVVVGGEMALQNMRFIQFLDEHVDAAGSPTTSGGEFVEPKAAQAHVQAMLRLSLYRDGWAVLAANFMPNHPRVMTMLHRALTTWNRRHTTYVADPLLWSFAPNYPDRFSTPRSDDEVQRLLAEGPPSVAALIRSQEVHLDHPVDLRQLGAISSDLASLIRGFSNETSRRESLLRQAEILLDVRYGRSAAEALREATLAPAGDEERSDLSNLAITFRLAEVLADYGLSSAALSLFELMYVNTRHLSTVLNFTLTAWIEYLHFILEQTESSISDLERILLDCIREDGFGDTALRIQLLLADAYRIHGDLDKAEEILIESADLPTTDMFTNLRAQNRLASLPSHRGDPAGAAHRWDELARQRVAGFGPRHVTSLQTRFEAARRWRLAGDLKRSLTVFTDLLADQIHACGPADIRPMVTRAYIAMVTANSGELSKADESIRQLLTEAELLFGPDHEFTQDLTEIRATIHSASQPDGS